MSFEASESIEKKMLHFDRKGKHKKVGFHQIKIVQSALEMYSSALISSMLPRGLCRHCQVIVLNVPASTFRKSDLKSVWLILDQKITHEKDYFSLGWKICGENLAFYSNKSWRSNLVIAPSTTTYFHDFCSQDKNLYNFIQGKIYSLFIKCRFKQLNQLTNSQEVVSEVVLVLLLENNCS